LRSAGILTSRQRKIPEETNMAKRRRFLQGSLTGIGAALASFGINPALAQEVRKAAGRSEKPL
jgi:hypothetical protein